MRGNRRAFWQAAWRHALFGAGARRARAPAQRRSRGPTAGPGVLERPREHRDGRGLRCLETEPALGLEPRRSSLQVARGERCDDPLSPVQRFGPPADPAGRSPGDEEKTGPVTTAPRATSPRGPARREVLKVLFTAASLRRCGRRRAARMARTATGSRPLRRGSGPRRRARRSSRSGRAAPIVVSSTRRRYRSALPPARRSVELKRHGVAARHMRDPKPMEDASTARRAVDRAQDQPCGCAAS